MRTLFIPKCKEMETVFLLRVCKESVFCLQDDKDLYSVFILPGLSSWEMLS